MEYKEIKQVKKENSESETPKKEKKEKKGGTFWQKLGNAVKDAVDCCLDG